MARRSITRYGPKGGVYHEHVNVGGGSSGGCGCILFIAAAVLVVAVVGGLIMMAVSGTDWYGVPRGSHNALTMTSTCQDWSAEKDAMGAGQEAAFFTAHVQDNQGNEVGFSDLSLSTLNRFCRSHPRVLLADAIPGRVMLTETEIATRRNIHP
jgi:hypothetical protein